MIFPRYPTKAILPLMVACALSWLNHSVIGQEAMIEGRWLVLKNGGVIEGLVQRQTDHFSVQTPQGSRLVIPFSKADFAAESLSQVYWKRLTAIPATDIAQHENLFHWCLNHQLWEEAKNQLEVLKAIGMDESRLATLTVKIGNSLIVSKNPKAPTPSHSSQTNQAALPLKRIDVFENVEPVFQALPSIARNRDHVPNQLANDVFTSQFEDKQQAIADDSDPTAGRVIQIGFQEDVEPSKKTGTRAHGIETESHLTKSWEPPKARSVSPTPEAPAKTLAEPKRLSPSSVRTPARQLPSSSSRSADGSLETIGDIPSLKEAEKKFKPRDEFDPEIFNRKLD